MKVLVFGTFDRLHKGHRFLLTEASKRGALHVVVARDQNVLRIKGRLPEQNEETRKNALAREFPQASVLLGDPEDFLVPVRSLKPDLIILGYDQELPPQVRMEDLHTAVERLPPFEPETYKSSLRRGQQQ